MADGPATDSGEAPFGVPSGGDDERDETVEQILQTVHQLFEAFSNSDAATFSSLVDDEARFVRTGYDEEGSAEVVSYPKEYFVSTLTSAKKGYLQERIAQPFVQHRDTMAHVWCRYALTVGGEPRYTGVKSIQLRAAADGGWRVVNICDTVDS